MERSTIADIVTYVAAAYLVFVVAGSPAAKAIIKKYRAKKHPPAPPEAVRDLTQTIELFQQTGFETFDLPPWWGQWDAVLRLRYADQVWYEGRA